jgi:FAD/FMN-containing dehydrogenase
MSTDIGDAVASPSVETLDRLRRIVGAKGVIDDPRDMEPYLVEWRGFWRGPAALVLRPVSTQEVSDIVKVCAEAGIGIVPQGGNTGLSGGGIPFEHDRVVLLNLGRMNNVRKVDALNYTIEVEAGCVLAEVQRAADAADRLFPLSLAAEGSCQIGGNLSTNAGGTAVLRYGNARDLALGLEVVLPDGQVWNGLRSLRKDNTGYDLKDLFIGAEGTLGIITAAVLKLFPKPRDRRTALAALPNVDATIRLLDRARAATGDQVTTFEYMPRICIDLVLEHVAGAADPFSRAFGHYVLIELTSSAENAALGEALENLLAAAIEDGLIVDAVVAQSETQIKALWKLREALAEAQKHAGASIRHDVSVPVSRVPDFVREASRRVDAHLPGARIVGFGHIGDGNVHFNVMQPPGSDSAAFLKRWSEINDIVHRCVAEFSGSISAEHGIGRLKRDELPKYKSATELALMRRIKAALDPSGIMNPGKVIQP